MNYVYIHNIYIYICELYICMYELYVHMYMTYTYELYIWWTIYICTLHIYMKNIYIYVNYIDEMNRHASFIYIYTSIYLVTYSFIDVCVIYVHM